MIRRKRTRITALPKTLLTPLKAIVSTNDKTDYDSDQLAFGCIDNESNDVVEVRINFSKSSISDKKKKI